MSDLRTALSAEQAQRSTCGSVIRTGRRMAIACAAGCAVILAVAPVHAQFRAVPKDDYYASFRIYNDGDYATSFRAFRSAYRGGISSTEGRWIDSICYHTMMGESLYHMGNLGDALDQYTAALRLLLTHHQWLLRIDFSSVNLTASSRSITRPPTWGNSSRANIQLANVPDRMQSQQGRVDNEQVLRQGGVVAAPFLYSVDAQEIVRCSAIALRRRMEIMGPTCQHDPLTAQLANVLSQRPTAPNHWSQAWISLQLGLAYASAGKPNEAANELTRSLLLAGQFDHKMTGMALVELGKLAFQQGNYEVAAASFYEATFTAAVFDQWDILEEAFRLGALAHIATQKPGVYTPLAPAAAWAQRGPDPLQASLLLSAAEQTLAAGDLKQGGVLLDQSFKAMRRAEASKGSLGARWQYQNAILQFQTGNLAAGSKALAETMAFAQKGSRWLFQIGLADRLFQAGGISEREADLMFEQLLRDPQPGDWSVDPMETLAYLVTPHLGALEHWFELAVSRAELDKAVAISDRVRRYRFYSSMPLGGRMLSLRWLLEAPTAALSEKAKLQRQAILNRLPAFGQLSQQAAEVRQALREMPLVPENAEQQRLQTKLFAQLADISAQQELALHGLSLTRQAADLVFPPVSEIEQVQQKLQAGQNVLVFFSTQRSVFAFLITPEEYVTWQVEGTNTIKRSVSELLTQIGNYDRNQQVGSKELGDTAWQETGRKLFEQLSGKLKPESWNSVEELIVVPDGVLWYVPFEMLPVPGQEQYAPLLSRMRVRYAPTISLAVPDERGFKRLARTAVVTGRLFPRDEDQVAQAAFDRLREVVPDSVQVATNLPAPSSLLAAVCDRLVVLADVENASEGPYEWSPMVLDRGKAGSALGTWMSLPFGTPDQVVLPGFHTDAENGLKSGGNGNEIFLAACAMMASGTRTVLLSRWRTGGQTSFDLVREFTQELPHTSASSAWQRSVELAWATELDPAREPRLKADTTVRPKGSHPFFWSSYLLLDTGAAPAKE